MATAAFFHLLSDVKGDDYYPVDVFYVMLFIGLYERVRLVDKFKYFQQNIENPLIEIINVHSQDDNFKRQWLEIHVQNHDLQHTIAKLSQMSMKVLRTIGQQKQISEASLVELLGYPVGVVNKAIKLLMHDELINKSNVGTDKPEIPYQLTAIGRRVVEAQNQIEVLVDRQHAEMVEKYSKEELATVARFLQDLKQNH